MLHSDLRKYAMNRHTIIPIIFLILSSTGCSYGSVPAATPTSTLAPNMGRVIGALHVRSGEAVQPVRNAILYLARTLKDSAGNESVAVMDPVNSPKTLSDDEGRFMFPNVEPGNYGLVLFAITTSYMLNQPDTNESFVITVTAGNQTDLGTLIYSSLPIGPRLKPYP